MFSYKYIYKNYFRTGDIGYLDENNYLYYMGRLKNIMNISGVNVFPEDIEGVIKDCDKIVDCCVTSIIQEDFSERILAIIHTFSSKTKALKEVKQLCFDKLSDFQIPHYYCFVSDFPKTSIGKIIPNIKASPSAISV